MEGTTLNSPHIRTTIGYKNTAIQDLLSQDFYIIDDKDTTSFFQEFKEFVFQVPKNLISCFSDIKFEYSNPNLIDNAIIKYSKTLSYNMLNKLLNTCQLTIYAYEIDNEDDFLFFLNSFKEQIISILIDYQKIKLNEEDLHLILNKYYNVLDLYLINSQSIIEKIKAVNQTTIYSFSENEYNTSFSYNKKTSGFRSNLQLYTESQHQHTYFNRKLYIGANGEIKNAPECEEVFGNIQDLETPEDIKKIIDSSAFQKYWNVHKELTDVCKECEFRHMCVDNRVPYQRKSDEWYHKQECNYNPYIAKWSHEDGYHTLVECGVISNKQGFSIDHDKIAKINKALKEEDKN